LRYKFGKVGNWRWLFGLTIALLLTVITLTDNFLNTGAAPVEASTDAYYRFKPGETLEGVALRFSLSVRTLQCANPTYKPGDAQINLPLTAAVRHTVQPGQTLGEIAQLYKVEIPVITRFPLNYWPGCPGIPSLGLEQASNSLPAGLLLYVPASPILPKNIMLGFNSNQLGDTGGKLGILPTITVDAPTAGAVLVDRTIAISPEPVLSSTEITGPPATPTQPVATSTPKVGVNPAQPPLVQNQTLIWPIKGKITTYFSTAHPGTDISNAAGTPVEAAQAGFVYFASWSPYGYGNFVQIEHGNGRQSHYAHLRLMTVKYGDFVQQGQIIGYEGSTGNSTGPHLHFELVIQGQYVNPLDYLPK
jgi:murein DD-endopeptidase MepM/ murein hydrolase activator NlpD